MMCLSNGINLETATELSTCRYGVGGESWGM